MDGRKEGNVLFNDTLNTFYVAGMDGHRPGIGWSDRQCSAEFESIFG